MAKGGLSGNVGEWSEPYVVLRLAADGILFQSDEQMRPSDSHFARVVKIEREDLSVELDGSGSATFLFTDKLGQAHTLFIPEGGAEEKARRLLHSIQSVSTKSGSFVLPEMESELSFLGFSQLKNPVPADQRFVKRDISLYLEDPNTGIVPRLGFSVKSELGSAPTLLNASDATNVVFRLYGMTDAAMNEVNAINTTHKIIDRCERIKSLCTEIRFDHYARSVFMSNLRLIDGDLPDMLAEAMRLHYFEGCATFEDAVETMQKSSRYADCDPVFCAVKMKRFLRACALGMVPSEAWHDNDDATGGYVIVLPDGSLIGFYIYNRALFDQYLLQSTRFERGSMSRHGYMSVFKKDGKYFVKLNLQIRFTR